MGGDIMTNKIDLDILNANYIYLKAQCEKLATE